MTVKTSQQALNEIVFQSYTVLVCFQRLSLNIKAKEDQGSKPRSPIHFPAVKNIYKHNIRSHTCGGNVILRSKYFDSVVFIGIYDSELSVLS